MAKLKSTKKDLRQSLRNLSEKANTQIKLCDECKKLVPDGDLLTFDGSSCCTASSYESGYPSHIYICDSCYKKNINLRELIRNIRDFMIFLQCNLSLNEIITIEMGNFEHWLSCLENR